MIYFPPIEMLYQDKILDKRTLAENDRQGYWAERICLYWERLLRANYGAYARLSAAFWGVHLGKNCKFYGRTRFRRKPGSIITIGDNCRFRSAEWSNQVGINRPCTISTLKTGAEIKIGSDCGMSGTSIAAAERIEIANNVKCGANVTITDTDWHTVNSDQPENVGTSPVHIGENVWLGLNVTVLKGVTIGHGAVIGVGSIVTRSIPSKTIAVGSPARVVKKL